MDVRTREQATPPNDLGAGQTTLPDVDDDLNPVVDLAEGDPEENIIVESGDSTHHASEEDVAEEEEARPRGWVSRDEWVANHGNEKGWKPAKEYNDFHRNMLPLVQRENRTLRQEVQELKRIVGGEQAERQAAKDRIEREALRLQLRQAREDQDWDKVDELGEKMLGLQVREVVKTQPTQPAIDPEVQQGFNDFASQNKWLAEDKDLAIDFATQLRSIVEARIPGMTQLDCMNKAKRNTMALNPDKFNRRSRPAMADSGGFPGVSRGTGNQKSWADLKPEVKAEFEDMISSTPGLTRAGILKNCDASHFRS